MTETLYHFPEIRTILFQGLKKHFDFGGHLSDDVPVEYAAKLLEPSMTPKALMDEFFLPVYEKAANKVIADLPTLSEVAAANFMQAPTSFTVRSSISEHSDISTFCGHYLQISLDSYHNLREQNFLDDDMFDHLISAAWSDHTFMLEADLKEYEKLWDKIIEDADLLYGYKESKEGSNHKHLFSFLPHIATRVLTQGVATETVNAKYLKKYKAGVEFCFSKTKELSDRL